jgi:hypothetical protein
MRRQLPGRLWTFTLFTGEKITGRLPKLGKSNKFALWKGSRWISRRDNALRAQQWYRDNIERGRVLRNEYNRRHPERKSVQNHFYCIIKQRRSNYRGMPFFNKWNPKKGGSYQAGADWIIANLGRRPKDSTLHIIDHEKGFVPHNLEWAHPKKQSNQQMFKIIAQQRHRILTLEKELDKYRKVC